MPQLPAGSRFDGLVALIARLRAPGGCPWDREQTHETLKSMTIEEAYEVVEAIDHGGDELAGELGDLLLQVVYHAQIAAESRRFDVGDVIDRVTGKMVRRHPHVFGELKADSSDDVLRHWEAMKAAERSEDGKDSGSMLDSVSRGLPAIMEAYQMTTKVSRVGFDWPSAAAVLEKLDEEVAELKATLAGTAGHQALQDEVGDLLFVAVNLARRTGIDPESALKATNRKFRSRFRHVEQRLSEAGRSPAESNLEEMDALWNEAKAAERRPDTPKESE